MDNFLSVDVLREAYRQALLENHNEDFIHLIRDELIKKETDSSKKTLLKINRLIGHREY
ncbi:sporulation histidine kinase inhibitor Sda [Alkalicoccobacillus murimartini]|uniref:Sporulation histidine kinase inhibitor Sda n=1 Tax=Alkalicoccobacillus murimartini TaxID=171685 RepID=A0ABT9YDL3_9BACI|nr:sporulation histidine kinase inhibitor Sda [Alkalicoccobacillus murimartini]MDQ0205942.1 hypothetical protein [Alkalicoccobacillus murimartini]